MRERNVVRHGIRTCALLALALGVMVVSRPASARVEAQAAAQTFEGTLSVVWGDPRDQRIAGDIRYVLETRDGRYVPMRWDGDANAALALAGKRVVVTGRMASPQAVAGAGDSQVIAADSIASDPGAQAVASPADAAVTGTKKVLFLLTKFQDDVTEGRPDPHPASFFTSLTNPDTPPGGLGIPATINGFFKKVSNNNFSWVGEVGGMGGIGGSVWITLPRTKSGYAPCGFGTSCFNLGLFSNEAVNAAKLQGINFALYDTINFVISNDLDCCAWGGSWSVDGISHGATWEPPWGQETRVYSHELGHSLGLPHSGWVYYSYDSPWDVMSDYSDLVITACGSYFSRNSGSNQTISCREPGNGYIAPHRDVLGWFPPANVVTASATSSTTVTLEGGSLAVGSGVKMLKICLPGLSCTGTASGTHYFTVEARVKNLGSTSLYDNGIPNEGVIIHDVLFGRPAIFGGCFFNSQSGWAVPIDSTPGDYNSSNCTSTGALRNAQFGPGQSYTNSTYAFRVNVLGRSGSSFVVSLQSTLTTQVAMDQPAGGSTQATPFTVSGWAINRTAASGTGVDAIHVYATPSGGGAAIFLGVAAYGSARSDIGGLYGAQFTNSGYTLSAGSGLAAGSYTVTAYAHNASTATFDAAASASVTVSGPATNTLIAIGTPANGQVMTSAFEVGGWAIDQFAPTGTGVDAVQFYVFPNDGASPGVFIGTGSYGSARPDVGALFGSRFANSGFHFTITGLGPGAYLLGVYARSTVTGAFSVKTLHFTVNATSLMSIDAPGAEAAFAAASFGVAGWSIDRTVEGTSQPGTGVDTLHVYAYPNPGSGQPPIFLGVASVGIARGDVAAIYGARYANSGYVLNIDRSASGLTPGVYDIVVHSHSSVANAFTNLALVRVTLQ